MFVALAQIPSIANHPKGFHLAPLIIFRINRYILIIIQYIGHNINFLCNYYPNIILVYCA